MVHQLKCESKYFKDVVEGEKTFEIRNNDRDFHVGDFVGLNEITDHPCNGKGEHLETGRCALFYIHYILDDEKYMNEGFVILGLKPCGVTIYSVGDSADVFDETVIENA